MGKNQSASGLTNVIQYSNGNITFVSGSTTLMSISSSGAITTTGVISGSNALSASYAANADTLDGLNSTAFATTGAYSDTSGSLYTVSSSAYATSGSLSTASGSFNSRVASLETYSTNLTAKTASFATTGSNTFIGTQVISGSILQSGSFTTTGTIIAQTINVQSVTSSVVYSSGSNVFGNDIGNSQRFTGSVLITGSLTIAGGSSATSYSGTTIYGSTAVCSANGLLIGNGGVTATCNYLPKFTGASTIGNSNIQDNGTTVQITGAATFSSSVTATSFIKTSGTSAQILAADGSVITAGTNITISGGTISASGGGSITLSAIGSTPNANAATLTGSALNLEPASTSFGGVVTTGTQTFAGAKTFSDIVTGASFIPTSATIPTNGMYLSAANTLNFATNSANRISINSSGNLIINNNISYTTTVYAWGGTNFKYLQFQNYASLSNADDGTKSYVNLSYNSYEASALSFRYMVGDLASRYQQRAGIHSWYVAGSGSANATISFTQAMTLDNSANLGIGTATIGSKLQVNGNAAIGYSASTAAPTNGLAVSGAIYLNKTTGTSAGINAVSLQVNNEIMATGPLGGFFMENRTGGVTAGSNWVGWYYSGTTLRLYNGAADVFSLIASTGATTFSSSVTATNYITGGVANTALFAATGYSLTGANAQSLLDLAGTWNTTGNPTAIKLNITNTASGATSKILDLQVGGTSLMNLTKGGSLLIGTTTDAGYMLDVNGTGRFSGNVVLSGSDSRFNGGDSVGRLILSNSNTTTYIGLYGATHPTLPYVMSFVVNSASALSISSTGAATFCSTITGTTIYGSTAVCSPVGLFSGCVGINCSAPSGKLQVANSSTQYALYTAGGNLELYTPEGNCGYVRLGSAYNLNGVYGSCGLNYITSGASYHAFYTTDSATERMRITSAGISCFACQICAPSGVKFGNGSSTLNYYEEGTWTPRLISSTWTSTATGGNAGWYTRIGNLVTVGGTVQWTGGSGAQGTLLIVCLPFTSNSTGNSRNVGQIGAPGGDSIAYTQACKGQFVIVNDPNQASMFIIETYQSGTWATYTHGPTVNNSGVIYGFQLTYHI
jgi:hypothetical protein